MTLRFLTSVLLTTSLCLTVSASEDYVRESSMTTETFTSRIIKDLSFTVDGADYTAFVVKWRDQEVVVSADFPLAKPYTTGDSIRCSMRAREFNRDGETQRVVSFRILESGRPYDLGDLSKYRNPDPEAERERLMKVAEEVLRRRAER